MKFGAKEKDTYRLCAAIGVMLVIFQVIRAALHMLFSGGMQDGTNPL